MAPAARILAVAAWVATAAMASGPLEAQRVTGRVLDGLTEERVAAAQVSLLDTAGTVIATASSDSAGYFVLQARRAGTYRLRTLRLGYGEHSGDVVELRAGETVTVVIRLAPQGLPLRPLEVRARGGEERGRDGFERRRALGKGVFLTLDSIRLREPRIMSDAFYGIPGIQVFEGMGYVQVYPMTGGKCFVMFRDHWPAGRLVGVLPDLRRPVGGDRYSGLGPINNLKLDWVQAIEIYRDITELPQELRTALRMSFIWPSYGIYPGGRWRGEPCGMIWIWTNLGW